MTKKKPKKKPKIQQVKKKVSRLLERWGIGLQGYLKKQKIGDVMEAGAILTGTGLFYTGAKAFEATPMLKDYGPFGFLVFPEKPEDLALTGFGVWGSVIRTALEIQRQERAQRKQEELQKSLWETRPDLALLREASTLGLAFFGSYYTVKHGLPFSQSLLGVKG